MTNSTWFVPSVTGDNVITEFNALKTKEDASWADAAFAREVGVVQKQYMVGPTLGDALTFGSEIAEDRKCPSDVSFCLRLADNLVVKIPNKVRNIRRTHIS